MSPSKPSLALIGCGKMGGAMLKGWIENKAAASIAVLEPRDMPAIKGAAHYKSAAEMQEALKTADVIVLAVKPQIMDKACSQIAPNISDGALVLSIAAGQTISSFEKRFGDSRAIIRAMPNTPAAIGKGITVACPNQNVSDTQKETANALLGVCGMVEWIEDEDLLDAVTALSGSGPAYVFLLMEMLARAGEAQGLDPALAMTLARQTVIGAAALAESEPDVSASQLRKNVTSPGGTTEAALDILMDKEVQAVFNRALTAATKRGKELNNSLH